MPAQFEPSAEASAFVALAVAFHRCFRLAVMPERLSVVAAGGKLDRPRDRLDALVNQLRRNIENMSEEGFPEVQGTPGQKTALHTLELVADALREELTAVEAARATRRSAFTTIKDLHKTIRRRLRGDTEPGGG